MNNFNKNLGKNPTLISLSDLNSLSSTNLVGVDNFKKIFETNKFSFSSRLLNFIEPEKIKGIQKTVFYSEVNTEFDKGDKVFIINGNYDSNSYIKTNKYDLDSDGYEVLDIDNGRIVLDVKYDIDKLPYTEVDESDVINIYYVSSIEELEQVSANINIDDSGSIYKKFGVSSNNVIYYDGDLNHTFENIFDPSHVTGDITIGPTIEGFHEIDGLNWNDINSDFDSGIGKFTNKKIRIINSDFGDYKKGFVYKFEGDKWIPSIENLVPIISKTNFRGGNMLGSFNSGVYGKSESVLEWNYPDAEWGGGFLYNSNWINGSINSLDTGSNTFVTRLKDGVPVEESVNPNNNGFGYNYILNSNVKGGVLNNGNIINSNIGIDTTNNIVKDYIENSIPTTSFIEVNGGLFLDSNIKNSILKDSILNHTNIENILFNDCLSINSQIESSVFKNSTYITDDVIKILSIKDYDNSYMNKYQFEISKQSYDRLELGNYFYIKGLIFTKDPNPVNFFHLKFKLSTWVETFEYVNGTNLSEVNLKITSFLSEENDKYYVNILFKDNTKITFPSTSDIDSTNAFILDSNYESGLFESSDWNSGYNINYNKNNITHDPNPFKTDGEYNLEIQTDKIKIKTSDIDIVEDEVAFLNSIESVDSLSNVTQLPDTYIGLGNKKLQELPFNNILSSILPNIAGASIDLYITGEGYNRKGYVHKLKFTDSKIKSGLFKRTYFKNCLIENKSYDSSDKDFNDFGNIRSLLIDESIFHKNDNFLSSATYVNCLISKKEDVFVNGIVYNSIWDGGVFNKGVFKESTWVDGEFNGGLFYKNRTFDATPTIEKPLLVDNRISSKYKSGEFPNNRYSWRKGIFNGGEIIKSDWETGTFNGGRFSESKFYDGEINGGIIGNKSIDDFKTRIYQATINDTKVENAYLFTEDYEFSKVKDRTITWNNGVFEKGVFGSKNFTNERCYDKIGGGYVKQVDENPYLFISNNNHSFRLFIPSNNYQHNLTYTYDHISFPITPTPPLFEKYEEERSIKSISDSVGNLIEITYDTRSLRYPDYDTSILSKTDGVYGRVIKYSKNGDVSKINSDDWIITADDHLSDIYIDIDDNIYVCYLTKIEKWTSDKKLLWTINNNAGNTCINGDDEFIYIGGIFDNKGYLEKWNLDGEFQWRVGKDEGLDYNYTGDEVYLQKIILFGNFILINGIVYNTTPASYNHKIYKIDKLNGNQDSSYGDFNISIDIFIDYTYDSDLNNVIIVGKNSVSDKITFNTLDADDIITLLSSIPFTSVDGIYTNLEYYGGVIYTKWYDDSNGKLYLRELKTSDYDTNGNQIEIFTKGSSKIENQSITITTETNVKNRYDNLIFNRFSIRKVGLNYSRSELIEPFITDTSVTTDGEQTEGPNVYEISNVNVPEVAINNVEFEVVKISLNYSISKNTPYTGTYTDNPKFEVFKTDNNPTATTMSLVSTNLIATHKLETIKDDGSEEFQRASNWEPYEETIFNTKVGNDFKIKFSNDVGGGDLGDYNIKISQFCVYSKKGEMKSIWNDGSFNGGQFVGDGQWNDGTFNGGLFLSTYGIDDIWKLNSAFSPQFEYGWNNGKFNGGEFGNGQIENNSTWKNGEFNGGVFKGKLWNNGIFTNGKFEGGIDVPILGTDNSSSYVNSIFNGVSIDYESTRGIWNDGYVTAKKDRFVKDKKLFTDLRKNTNDNKVVLFEDVVFESGTFSHENGVMKDSIWLGGTFESGTFEDSVFNPFRMAQFASDDNCIWENGLFKGGDFYYSKWNGGLFNTGNAYGMIWNGGICNYMNAYNILWRSGTWKNGNWFGSDFEFTGSLASNVFEDIIMDRINDEYGKDEYHLWNVFKDEPSESTTFGSGYRDDTII